MTNTHSSYLLFYRDAWREHVQGLSASPMSLNAASDLDWTSFALSLNAFETAYELAQRGLPLDEGKKLYLASLDNKNGLSSPTGE